MIWRFICCRHCNTKADVLRGSSHSRDNCQGFIDRPLSTRDNGRIEVSGAFVDIIAACFVSSSILRQVEGRTYLGHQQ